MSFTIIFSENEKREWTRDIEQNNSMYRLGAHNLTHLIISFVVFYKTQMAR